ncbi:hypothetical protein NUW58_g3630 [Xylaria curta]|uniref:Uncharacterized protein n=1 Tax=Xylaria curta TaxID=42375 RepID=A0ACC1PAM0_9PEZI|nr:hypothetical protein NUW58_g3630 [Xylaria curta]
MRFLLPFLAICSSTAAYTCSGRPKTVSLQWSLGWKWIAPDGFGRPVVAVNDQWPPPKIDMCNETASIHWHGLYQKGQNQMDGPAMTTQCPIPPGSVFTYDFTVSSLFPLFTSFYDTPPGVEQQVGTYWWHSHVHGQIADGLRGPLIIHDPNPPYNATGVLPIAENAAKGGPEPLPDTGLLNDGHNVSVNVKPGETYLLRVINPGNFAGTYLRIEGHNFTIVEVDGVYTEPYTVDLLYLAVAQRYGVLLTTHKSSNENFLIQAALDTSMFDETPGSYNSNFYGYLIYDSSKPLPTQAPLPQNPRYFDDIDLATSSAYVADQVSVYGHVDIQLILDLNFTIINNQIRATLNGTTGIPQLVPSLYTALSAGANAWNPLVYGVNSIPSVLKYDQVVEVIINNFDVKSHPWHLHGATFQVIARNGKGNGYYKGERLMAPHPNPLRRDTVTINPGGLVALRFKTDNPGVHLMHCHIEWHVEAGLTATLVVAPDIMQRQISIPQDHIAACRRQHIPTTGNAAGNKRNFLDLRGAPTIPDPHPKGALINSSLLGPPGKYGEWWPSNRKHWEPWMPPAPPRR